MILWESREPPLHLEEPLRMLKNLEEWDGAVGKTLV